MIDALFTQPNYAAAKKMMDMTIMRHEAITQNLGHLEVANYRRIDVAPSFRRDLQEAMRAQDVHRINQISPHVQADATAKARGPHGNNVALEEELAQLNQNALEHTVEAQMITSSLLRMRLAITGRPQ